MAGREEEEGLELSDFSETLGSLSVLFGLINTYFGTVFLLDGQYLIQFFGWFQLPTLFFIVGNLAIVYLCFHNDPMRKIVEANLGRIMFFIAGGLVFGFLISFFGSTDNPFNFKSSLIMAGAVAIIFSYVDLNIQRMIQRTREEVIAELTGTCQRSESDE